MIFSQTSTLHALLSKSNVSHHGQGNAEPCAAVTSKSLPCTADASSAPGWRPHPTDIVLVPRAKTEDGVPPVGPVLRCPCKGAQSLISPSSAQRGTSTTVFKARQKDAQSNHCSKVGNESKELQLFWKSECAGLGVAIIAQAPAEAPQSLRILLLPRDGTTKRKPQDAVLDLLPKRSKWLR